MGLNDTRTIGRKIHAETNFNSSELARFSLALGVPPKDLLNFDFDINPELIPPLPKKGGNGGSD